MLKDAASSVLPAFRLPTYASGYASGLHSLRHCRATCLSILPGQTSCSLSSCLLNEPVDEEKAPLFR